MAGDLRGAGGFLRARDIAGYGIATARMLSLDDTAGAFSGLAMGLCGLITAVLVPLVFHR
jgi:putative effector of murein hydrolase